MRLSSFPPLVGRTPRVLVLGTMPGAASLAAGQYYAHPRNQFWPLMARVAGFEPGLPYPRRVAALKRAGIALWDVLKHCERPGSLDASIVRASEVANDLPGLLRRQRSIRAIFFNGGPAQQLYRRHLHAAVSALRPELHLQRLPSSSPAHAARTDAQKLEAWRVIGDWR